LEYKLLRVGIPSRYSGVPTRGKNGIHEFGIDQMSVNDIIQTTQNYHFIVLQDLCDTVCKKILIDYSLLAIGDLLSKKSINL